MAKKSTSKLFPEDTPVTEPTSVETDSVEEKEEEAKVIQMPEKESTDDDIQDIDLSFLKKKRFRINGDNSKILELNPTDMSITIRLSEAYPRLNKLMDDAIKRIGAVDMDSDDIDNAFETAANILKDIDSKMRDEIDYIFDSNVSEICAPDGSMWDPVEGAFRYEHIIERLSALYETNLNKEFAAMKRKVEGRANKYATMKKYHR